MTDKGSAGRGGIRRLVVITGPTASGKTSLAIKLAQSLHTDVISADSRQIYRGMPITTACPSTGELSQVKHHFIGILDVDSYYSAAAYEQDVLALLPELAEGGDTALMCGGSMMYVDAVVNGIDEMPTVSDEVRQRVRDMRATLGDDALLAYLQIADPRSYERIDKANMRRVMHAIEICIQAGRPYSEFCGTGRKPRPFEVVKFAIDMPREQLFERINRRVDAMVDAGMEDEARRFYSMRHLNALNTVGFKEWFAHFDGIMDRDTTIARIKKNTRVYAKKQLTWLASDPLVVRLDASGDMLAQILGHLEARGVKPN